MSAEDGGWASIPNWLVRDPEVSSHAKLIYVYLNSRVGRNGSCWPALGTVATETGLSQSTVQRALRELRSLGVVAWWTETTARGRVNRYRMSPYVGGCGHSDYTPCGQGDQTHVVRVTNKEEAVEEETTPQAPQGAERALDGELIPVADVGGTGQTGNMDKPVATPSRKQREVSDDDQDWSAFWAAYPRKIGKGAARKAWTRALAKVTSPSVLIDGAKAEAADLETRKRSPRPEDRGQDLGQFVPHPSTWLNQERWEDEKQQQTGGARWSPAKKGEDCEKHPGEAKDRCRACAADRLAGDAD